MTELKEAAREHSKRYSSETYKDGSCTVIPSYTARNSFEAGAQWQAEQSPWISVEERLPEKDGTRVWVKGFAYSVLWHRGGKFYSALEGGYEISISGITHWMPILEV